MIILSYNHQHSTLSHLFNVAIVHHINDYVNVLCDHYFSIYIQTRIYTNNMLPVYSFICWKTVKFLFYKIIKNYFFPFLCKFKHRPLLNQFKVVMFNKTLLSSSSSDISTILRLVIKMYYNVSVGCHLIFNFLLESVNKIFDNGNFERYAQNSSNFIMSDMILLIQWNNFSRIFRSSNVKFYF